MLAAPPLPSNPRTMTRAGLAETRTLYKERKGCGTRPGGAELFLPPPNPAGTKRFPCADRHSKTRAKCERVVSPGSSGPRRRKQ